MDKEKVKKVLYRIFIGKKCNCSDSCANKNIENKETKKKDV